MGEVQGRQTQLSFNRSIRIAGGDERMSSAGGMLLLRELDERLGLTRRLGAALADPRCAGRVTWSLTTQLRARLYTLAAGFGAQRDVAALASDPALRLSSTGRRGVGPLTQGLMSQPTLARLQRLLGLDHNLHALQRSVLELGIAVIRAAGAARGAHTIDVDSMPVMSHGQQPGSVWNDYYRGRCFHPLLAMHGETGTMLGAQLRPGNVAQRRVHGASCSIRSRASSASWGSGWDACAAIRASRAERSCRRWRSVERTTSSASRTILCWGSWLLHIWLPPRRRGLRKRASGCTRSRTEAAAGRNGDA